MSDGAVAKADAFHERASRRLEASSVGPAAIDRRILITEVLAAIDDCQKRSAGA
jgi:hypothetical protein